MTIFVRNVFCITYMYLNSESDTSQLRETVDALESQPVVFVISQSSKPVTKAEPWSCEIRINSNKLLVHQDPVVDRHQWNGAQNRSSCFFVLGHKT